MVARRSLIAGWHDRDDEGTHTTVPGVGLHRATAFAVSVVDPSQFRSGHQFAAWLGLTGCL